MSVRSGIRGGLITAAINIFCILLGVTTLVGSVITGWFKGADQAIGAWLVLLVIAFWGGRRAARELRPGGWAKSLVAGLCAGLVHGLVVAGVILLLGNLAATGIDLRQWLVQLGTESIVLLLLSPGVLTSAIVAGVLLLVASLLGGLYEPFSEATRWHSRLSAKVGAWRQQAVAAPAVSGLVKNPTSRMIVMIAAVVLVLAAPFFLGQYWNYTVGTVGIYVILGLGLNIIVGMAGLLVLGYAAFFAVGAYTVAILTAPAPHHIQMSFWLAMPIGVALACLSAVLLGLPVLRMRGDYLAIVTLGFGEIIRILVRSDVLLGFTGGPRGIRSVGHPTLFGADIGNEFYFMYIILIGILLAIFITRRLENSKVGRAWRATREDERVAQAMGINMLKYKLLAFATSAAFAGLAGAIFASRNSFTGPEDFTLLVSINVLALLIVGGLGSVPGVIVGAVVLKGLPELLRQLDDYRILVFGALLVVMMIWRPEGLWPSGSIRLERSEDETEPVPADA